VAGRANAWRLASVPPRENAADVGYIGYAVVRGTFYQHEVHYLSSNNGAALSRDTESTRARAGGGSERLEPSSSALDQELNLAQHGPAVVGAGS
jgi:hypothetical protein